MRRAVVGLVAALASVASVAVVGCRDASAATTVTNGCITSVPEPGSTEPVPICWTLYRPAGADAAHPVPMILDSHGWGGSRMTAPDGFADLVGAGFGVLSFDQRGFGESGGKAHVQHPDFEGRDVQSIVDMVTALDWVAKEAPGDPVLGAMGGSYGGGYQLVGAYTELRDRGATRFDALAPEITWWDLRESLAPNGVPRTAWVTSLYTGGMDAHTDEVHRGFAYGVGTGDWPAGQNPLAPNLDWLFAKNGPAWHAARGRLLDIPVLIGQGSTDNLFNLNQGLKIFDRGLTPAARARSIFVGYNDGHVLPGVMPLGYAGMADEACEKALGGGTFFDLRRRFFAEELRGAPRTLRGHGQAHVATPEGRCVTVGSTAPNATWNADRIVATVGAGAPIATRIAGGPLTIATMPTLTARVTTTSVDARLFAALSIGTTQADARVLQNNMLPLRVRGPVVGREVTIELPALAADVPDGMSLFLTLSPVSDVSFGHGSRVAAPILLEDVTLRYARATS